MTVSSFAYHTETMRCQGVTCKILFINGICHFFFFFFKWWVYILFTRLPTCTLLMSLLGYIDYIDSYGCYNSFFFFWIVFVFFLHSVGPYNFFFRDVYKFFIWAESFDTWMPRERSGSVIFFPGYWETF